MTIPARTSVTVYVDYMTIRDSEAFTLRHMSVEDACKIAELVSNFSDVLSVEVVTRHTTHQYIQGRKASRSPAPRLDAEMERPGF